MTPSLWNKCLDRLADELSSQQFNTWIRPLQAVQETGQLRLIAPNQFVHDWVSKRFMDRIHLICRDLERKGTSTQINLEIMRGDAKLPLMAMPVARKESPVIAKPEAPSKPVPVEAVTEVSAPSLVAARKPPKRRSDDRPSVFQQHSLNSLFTFESFVEGKSNQLAHAAAQQIAQNPGGAYNPLFMYGGVGLGKTHLLHAIGNSILARNPKARVAYLTSEKFVQDMVKALQQNAIGRFKTHYRSLNVLLIDDIQFFAGKERSQEEFFHTFNALLEGQQQVVLTCDRYPKEVTGLEERLKSRFGWGLTIAIEPPELETRAAILMKKAHLFGVNLPNDVAFFIAKRIRSNIRDLEGALRTVIANANFTGSLLTMDLAKEALKDQIASHDRLVTIDNIQKVVSEYFKIRRNDLLTKTRTRSVARPRQVAMSLAKELTNHSLPEIGGAFGGRDHTTVLHAHKKIAELRECDNRMAEDYSNLLRILST